MRPHVGTLVAGIFYLFVGVALFLEGLEVWTLRIGDLRYLAPMALVLAGLAVVIGSVGRADRNT